MESREEDIKELKASIKERERDRHERKDDRESYVKLTEEITAKTELLTTLIKAQQGKFASPVSVVLSHSYR